MILGYEAKRIFHNHSGLGSYARHLIEMLSAHYPQHQYRLYNPAAGTVRFTLPEAACEVRPRLANAFYQNLWRQRLVSAVAAQDGVQLFHGLSAELPRGLGRRGIPSVVTVHDLIFMRYPRLYSPIDRTIYLKKLRWACRRADQVVAISDQTKRDIQDFLKVPAGKISVIYPGLQGVFWQKDPSRYHQVMVRYRLPERYALFVGTLEPRKNPVALARQCLKRNIPLVLVGRKTDYWQRFYQGLSAGEQARLYLPRIADNGDLAAVYQMAEVFAYPSIFEGFGLPVLEAQVSGIPVVTSTESSLPEAAGPGCTLVHPGDEEALGQAVEDFWQHPDLCRKAVTQNETHVAHFSDSVLARQWINLYERTL